jgi:hypothetical protein
MLKNSAPLLLAILVAVAAQTAANSSYLTPCIAFQAGGCITCPFNYHQYQSQCYLNITGCTNYAANASGYLLCTTCDSSISVLAPNGTCTLTVSQQRK